jgi:hypothetical protein
MAVVIEFIADFCYYVFSGPRETNSTITNMWGSATFLRRTGSSNSKRVGTYNTRNGTMNVNDIFSYEHKAPRPLRDRQPSTLGAVTRKSDFSLLWTFLVKKWMINIAAQITLLRYSQTPHQFFASGHNTLFIRAETAQLSTWLAFCIALYEYKKSAVCLRVKKKLHYFYS